MKNLIAMIAQFLLGVTTKPIEIKYIPQLGDKVQFVGTHWKYGESAYYGFSGVVDEVGDGYLAINSGSAVLVCTNLASRHSKFQRVEEQFVEPLPQNVD